jgi:hypothetical protein
MAKSVHEGLSTEPEFKLLRQINHIGSVLPLDRDFRSSEKPLDGGCHQKIVISTKQNWTLGQQTFAMHDKVVGSFVKPKSKTIAGQ